MLIDRLTKQHAAIIKALAIIAEGAEAEPVRLRPLLSAVRRKLDAHLALENAQLYPALKRLAKKNEDLAYTVQVFAKDTRELSRALNGFFKAYSGLPAGPGFERELARLAGAVRHRIWKEENILYREYAKYFPEGRR